MQSFIVICYFRDLSYYGIVEKLMNSLNAREYPYGDNQWLVLYESEEKLQSYLDENATDAFAFTIVPTNF